MVDGVTTDPTTLPDLVALALARQGRRWLAELEHTSTPRTVKALSFLSGVPRARVRSLVQEYRDWVAR